MPFRTTFPYQHVFALIRKSIDFITDILAGITMKRLLILLSLEMMAIAMENMGGLTILGNRGEVIDETSKIK